MRVITVSLETMKIVGGCRGWSFDVKGVTPPPFGHLPLDKGRMLESGSSGLSSPS